MKRLLALTLVILATPALAKETRTTIAVSCIVVSSGTGGNNASVVTTRACGTNCVLKTTTF